MAQRYVLHDYFMVSCEWHFRLHNDSYLGIMLLYHMCESIPGCPPTPLYFLGAEGREWNEATFHLSTTDDGPTTLCITFCEAIFLIFNHITWQYCVLFMNYRGHPLVSPCDTNCTMVGVSCSASAELLSLVCDNLPTLPILKVNFWMLHRYNAHNDKPSLSFLCTW